VALIRIPLPGSECIYTYYNGATRGHMLLIAIACLYKPAIMTSFAVELATPSITYVWTPYCV